MYGNIGLPTAKGSGTSGYVQKSLAYVNKKRYESGNYKEILQKFKDNPAPIKRRANKEIIEHELKHKIEAELYDIAEEVKKEGKSEEEIEKIIKEKRKELYDNMNKNRNELIDTKETHQQSQLKDEQMDNIKRALGVKNDYVLGAAFDLELQEQKKEERKRIKKISDKKEHRHKHHRHRSRSRSRS